MSTPNIPILAKKPIKVIEIQAKQALHQAGLLGTKSQVKAAVDVSGSMENPNRFYSQGIVDGLVTRILGLGLNMDDNRSVEMIALDNGARELEPVNDQNLDGYVRQHLQPLVGGGTNYAPTIRKILETSTPGDPVLALCFTDGYNFDEREAEAALIAASNYPIFYQWFGIHREGRNLTPDEEKNMFPFLAKMNNLRGRRIDNAGFSTLSLTTVTDDELNNKMLVEYPSYLDLAKDAKLLPWDLTNDPTSGSGGNQPAGKSGSRFGGLFGKR